VTGVFQLSDRTILAVACLSQRHPVLYRIGPTGVIQGTTVVSSLTGCLRSPVQIGDDIVGASTDAVVRITSAATLVWSAPFPGVGAVLLQGNRVVAAAAVHLGPGRYGYELRRYNA
jgi:hypothetical protein